MTTTQTDEHTAEAAADRLLAVLNRRGDGPKEIHFRPVMDVDAGVLYFTVNHELDVVGDGGDPVTWSAVPHRTRQCWECDQLREAEEAAAKVAELLGVGLPDEIDPAKVKQLLGELEQKRRAAAEDQAVLYSFASRNGLIDGPF